jgi:uncharacterized protein YegL
MNEELKLEFVENPEQRCACMLLLDTSGSMRGGRLNALNAALKDLIQALREDERTAKSVDLAVMTFDSEVKLIQDFCNPDKFEPPTLTAQGQTHLGAAIREALSRLKERRREYARHHIPFTRPWLFLLTDGLPEGESPEELQQAAALLCQAQTGDRAQNKKPEVLVFGIGVGEADLDVLGEIISPSAPLKLNEKKWNELFQWLSVALVSRSQTRADQQAPIPIPTGWPTQG